MLLLLLAPENTKVSQQQQQGNNKYVTVFSPVNRCPKTDPVVNIPVNICSKTDLSVNKLVDNCSAGSLMWISLMIDNQMLFGMVDSGATPSCLAKRCVTASVSLRDLPRRNYTGNVISDVN